jgi:hypothetical protein
MSALCDTGCGNFTLDYECPEALKNNELICFYCCDCDYHEEDGV